MENVISLYYYAFRNDAKAEKNGLHKAIYWVKG